jgi:hypothetical protein
MPSSTLDLLLLAHTTVSSWRRQFAVIARIVTMWPPQLPYPSPDMSEETRWKKLAVAKKKLREYQQRNSSCRNKEEEKKM